MKILTGLLAACNGVLLYLLATASSHRPHEVELFTRNQEELTLVHGVEAEALPFT